MTELERELLRAFEDLQSDYAAQQQEWRRAYESLQTMFEATQRDNQVLGRQVTNLSKQVNDLSESVSRWTPGGMKR